MSEIIPGRLWLTSEIEANDPEFVAKCGATMIVTTANNSRGLATVQNRQFPIAENAVSSYSSQFDLITHTIHSHQGPVILHCVAGVNRSATAAIAYLMKQNGKTLKAAYNTVKKCRPQINPSHECMLQLMEYERRLFGTNSVSTNGYRSELSRNRFNR